SSKYHQRDLVGLVLHGRVIDWHTLLRGIVDGDAALHARNHLVLDANVRESAAHHYFMVAATRPVLVEVGGFDLVRNQIFTGRRVDLDRTGGGDEVRGHRIKPPPHPP